MRGGSPRVGSGLVPAVTADASVGWLVEGTMQPSGAVFVSRLLFAGTGMGTGEFWPVVVGDEVLVLLPDGDPNRAVAIAGLVSLAATPPTSFANDAPRMVHPSGKAFALSQAGVVQAVVLEAMLPDLLAWVTAVSAAFQGLGVILPTTLTTNLPASYRSLAIKSE